MKAAMAFGKLPHEWDEASKESKAEAIATMNVIRNIDSYQIEKTRKKK